MIELRILGTPALEDGNGGHARRLLSHPKRLALLAYLAATTNGTLARRDTVLALFWPEQPEVKARHALNQALHVLRRSLGAETVVTRGEGIGVDHERLWCDAAAFQDALRRGDYPGALGLYRGRLLEGFFAGESDGFERWLEELRHDLHDRAVAAARSCAEEAAARNHGEAVSWARRACELAPFDEEAARQLMQLLERSGDRPGALEAYGRLTSRLRHDLELEPSAETTALAEAIRAAGTPATGEPEPISAPHRGPVAPETRSPRFARPLLLGAACLTLLGLAWTLGGGGLASGSAAGPAGAPSQVAVLPFGITRDSTAAAPSAGEVVALLSARLDGAGRLRALPPDTVLRLTAQSLPRDGRERRQVAERLAAASYVEGALTARGGRLHIQASWLRTDQQPIAVASVEGEAGALFRLLDSLAFRLLAGAHTGPHQRIARVAIQSSPSLGALKAFLVGEAAFAEGRFDAAARAFERAAQDSTFALAHYRFGQAALWTSDYPLAAADAGARALRHAGSLPNRERRLLAAFDAWRTGNSYGAEHGPGSLIAADPDDLEAWLSFGESRFHYNPVLGREIAESREAFEQVVRLDPDHWLAHWHLALLDALAGRLPELDRRVALLERVGPDGDYRAELKSLQGCAHRDSTRLTRVLDSMHALGQGRITDIVWRCAVYGRNPEAASRIARLLLVRGGLAYANNLGRELLATLAMARGRRREALSQIDSLELVAPGTSLVNRSIFATLPLVSGAPDSLRRLLEEWRIRTEPPIGWWPPGWRQARHRMMGSLAAELGRGDEALRSAAALERIAPESSEDDLVRAQAAEIRGNVLARAGHLSEALRHYESVYPMTWFGFRVSAMVSGGLARFQRADALARAGREDEALGWYGSVAEFSTFDLVYAALGHLQRARLLERRKEAAAAAREYTRFLELWETADPEYQPLIREARERRAQLTAR